MFETVSRIWRALIGAPRYAPPPSRRAAPVVRAPSARGPGTGHAPDTPQAADGPAVVAPPARVPPPPARPQTARAQPRTAVASKLAIAARAPATDRDRTRRA